MFASDLGELFTNTSNGSESHSTGLCTLNTSENLRNASSLAHPSIANDQVKHDASTHYGHPKPPVSSSSAVLEDLFALDFERTSKSPHVNQIVSGVGSSLKTQLQLGTVGSGTAPGVESTSVSTKQAVPIHNRGTLQCPVCGKTFSNSSAIAKHKLTHSEERKYVCGICHKAFKRQDHLNGHKYTHESKKPHACHFCDKSYSDARSLRRHYENAHPEEYSRWLMLSQATNGDTSAIAVAAAALFSSSGLNKEAADSAAKELHVDPSTSVVLSSVFNGPVRSVLSSNLSRATSGFGTPSDLIRTANSESASPASSSAMNDNHGTSPAGHAEQTERDDEELHESRSLVTITAENMAAAAKVALIMAHPLEAPKRVACAVCQKRFKNQSALNGHMRLHGGYGPAGLSVSGLSQSSIQASTQAKLDEFHTSNERYVGPSELHEKGTVINNQDDSGNSGFPGRSEKVGEISFQHPDVTIHPRSSPVKDCSQLFEFMSVQSARNGSYCRPEALSTANSGNFHHEHSASLSGESTSNRVWSSHGDPMRPLDNQTVTGSLHCTEGLTLDSESLMDTELRGSSEVGQCSNQIYNMPRSASASTISSMHNCRGPPKSIDSGTSWSVGVNVTDHWQKHDLPRSSAPQPSSCIASNSNSLSKGGCDSSGGMTWWSGSHHLPWNNDSRRQEDSAWTNLGQKSGLSSDMTAQSISNKLPQMLDRNSKSSFIKQWNSSSLEDKPPARRRCNPALNLNLSSICLPEGPIRTGPHMGLSTESHLSIINCASGHVPQSGSQPHENAVRSQVILPPGPHMNTHPQCVPPTVGNQYSPVTPAPNSASLMLDPKIDQPSAFTFPPTEPVQSGSNSNTYSVDSHLMMKATDYCISLPARLPLMQENASERGGLRHSSSPGKLSHFSRRWQPESDRSISAHGSGISCVNATLDHQHTRPLHQLPAQHLSSGRQHIQHFPSDCNVFHKVNQNSYTNVPWSDHDTSWEPHCAEPSFSLIPLRDDTAHSGDNLCNSRQRHPSDQTPISKITESRARFVHPYSHNLASAGLQGNDSKIHVRMRLYQSATETSTSFTGTLSHSFLNASSSALHRLPQMISAEPERTRHTSAPFLYPGDYSEFRVTHSPRPADSTVYGHSDTSHGSFYFNEHRVHSPNGMIVLDKKSECDPILGLPSRQIDYTTSDTVANLLMQSHITDPFTMPEKLARCSPVGRADICMNPSSLLDRSRSEQYAVSSADPTHSVAMMTRPDCYNPLIVRSQPFSDAPLQVMQPPTTNSHSMATAQSTNTESTSVDESDQSAITRLSKSLVDDSLFRNPHTLPPPKKLKRKPAPIFIPPQTGANLSRLRSPRLWGSDASALSTSPLPYTPPPMLSPNRRGSGLFSSLSRWPSTASPMVTTRRYSSYYPYLSCGDVPKRKSGQGNTSLFCSVPGVETEGGKLLKRTRTNQLLEAGTSGAFEIPSSDLSGGGGVADASQADESAQCAPRSFAFPKRVCQLTPKSAPVLLQETSAYTFQTSEQSAAAIDAEPEASSGTVFGYDDETMRRIAEADAADHARRLRRQRRRCDTDQGALAATHTIQTETDAEEVSVQVNAKTADLMDYKPHEELEIVVDTLAVLDEEMRDKATYESEEDGEQEEGLPSSLIPRINVGEAFQANIPEFNPDLVARSELEYQNRELLLWYPGFIDESDPKNIESLNLMMKLSCSPAIRHCGLNMEYAFHLLCKYEGNVEKALHALLRDTFVVDDYIYAETTLWTTEEISRFQHGLTMHGRDFHLVARDLQAYGMDKSVKACVEFYYVWKRMNTPTDVKCYREKARRLRLNTRSDNYSEDHPIEENHPRKDPGHAENPNKVDANAISTYNLRRKTPAVSTTSAVSDHSGGSLRHAQNDTANSVLTVSNGDDLTFTSCPSTAVDVDAEGLMCTFNSDLSNLSNSYPCRICHRVFTKVKSLNAHMKSHSDRTTGPAASASRPLPQGTC